MPYPRAQPSLTGDHREAPTPFFLPDTQKTAFATKHDQTPRHLSDEAHPRGEAPRSGRLASTRAIPGPCWPGRVTAVSEQHHFGQLPPTPAPTTKRRRQLQHLTQHCRAPKAWRQPALRLESRCCSRHPARGIHTSCNWRSSAAAVLLAGQSLTACAGPHELTPNQPGVLHNRRSPQLVKSDIRQGM